jgi:ATP-dependent Clp protease ATP-binding subunit ClpA
MDIDYDQKWGEVLDEAVATARFLGYKEVTPGCILVGLLRIPDTVSANILRHEGFSLEKTLAVVSELGLIMRRDTSVGEMPYTNLAVAVIDAAKKSGEEMNHPYRGPEHLVLGIARIDDPVVKEIFYRVGTNARKLEDGIHSLLGFGEKAAA